MKWHYRRKLKKNETKLTDLQEEKKKIVEQVMDTETYKLAKTILEKFAPDNLRTTKPYEYTPMIPAKSITATAGTTLRQRNILSTAKNPLPVKSLASGKN